MVTVIDGFMGAGKSTAAFQEMNDHPSKRYICVVPYLTEVQRYRDSVDRELFEPENKGDGKVDSFKKLLSDKVDIVTTHSLFSSIDEETKKLLFDGGYTLIIDETLDVIGKVSLDRNDIEFLTNGNYISVDKDNFVHWTGEGLSYGRYPDVKRMCDAGTLIHVNSTTFMWQYVPDVFKDLFEDVYILTYMFDTSLMSVFFKVWDIKYNVKKFGTPKVPVIHIETDKNMATSGSGSRGSKPLSMNWFKNSANRDKVNQLKNDIQNYYRNKINSSADDFLITTYKEGMPKLSAKGYTYNKNKYEDGTINAWAPCNARGTNKYSTKHNVVYALNPYFPPEIDAYCRVLSKNNNIKADEDGWALSQMVQFVWRSAVRNGEEINLYVPSQRMFKLFTEWYARVYKESKKKN